MVSIKNRNIDVAYLYTYNLAFNTIEKKFWLTLKPKKNIMKYIN